MSEIYNGCDETEYIQVPGPRGEQGQRGLQGERGPQGPQGIQGVDGPQGPVGCQGPKGDRGPRGERGPAGPQGLPGLNGRDGAQGPEGPRGCKGADGTVRFEELTPEQRKMLVGPMGPMGPVGPQGDRGIQGIEGPEGPQGPAGTPGATGATGPAGPQGERGPQGPQGLRGATGPKGEPGSSHVTQNATDTAPWSAKRVIDYSTHGNVDWQRKTVNWNSKGGDRLPDYKIEGTENGYAKNIKIEGKTERNLSTIERGAISSVDNKNFAFIKQLTPLVIFNYAASQGQTRLQYKQVGYTFIYKLDGVVIKNNAQQTHEYNFDATIDVTLWDTRTQQRSVIKKTIDFREGYAKFFLTFQNENQMLEKIELKPLVLGSGASEEGYNGYTMSYNAKEFMILEGDYTYKIPPEYFYGEKGVGIRKSDEPGVFIIRTETRNKNLLSERENLRTNAYLKKADDGNPYKLIYARPTKQGSVASFVVYCKPEKQYTFSVLHKVGPTQRRMAISEYSHEPGNGELGDLVIYNAGSGTVKGIGVKDTVTPIGQGSDAIEEVTFTTKSTTNVLVIYVANFDDGRSPSATWHLSERCQKVQLEEGAKRTVFQPYESSTRDIRIDHQLHDREYLYWNEAKGEYYIHRDLEGGSQWEDVPTGVKTEELLHTYSGDTYVFVRSKIPSTITADFPIKAHVDYYTKAETQTTEEISASIALAKKEIKDAVIFNDREGQENLNGLFITFNGFRMTWRDAVIPMNQNELQINPGGITNILAIQVQRVIPHLQDGGENGTASVVTVKRMDNGVTFKIIDKAVNSEEDATLRQKSRHYSILIISQGEVRQ